MKFQTLNEKTIKDLESRGYKVRAQHFRHLQMKLGGVYDMNTKKPTKLGDSGVVTISKELYDRASIRGSVSDTGAISMCRFGGYTEVVVIDKESDKLVAQGHARCSLQDEFDSSQGFNIAINRAIKNAKL